MNNSLKHIITRFTCWVLLLQMVNISIDPPDLRQTKKIHVPSKEDLSINEIESVYELISEGVFHADVPEADDHDIDTETQTFDLYCYEIPYSLPVIVSHPLEHHATYLNTSSFVSAGPNAPPPKFA